jgi:hypothetical protein
MSSHHVTYSDDSFLLFGDDSRSNGIALSLEHKNGAPFPCFGAFNRNTLVYDHNMPHPCILHDIYESLRFNGLLVDLYVYSGYSAGYQPMGHIVAIDEAIWQSLFIAASTHPYYIKVIMPWRG